MTDDDKKADDMFPVDERLDDFDAMLADAYESAAERAEDGGGGPTVGAVLWVRDGRFFIDSTILSSEADVYLAIGLLDQLKMNLLSTVPRNKPLREPEPSLEERGADDEPPPDPSAKAN